MKRLRHLALVEPLDAERLEQVSRHAALPFRKRRDAEIARLEDAALLPWLCEALGLPARAAFADAIAALRLRNLL